MFTTLGTMAKGKALTLMGWLIKNWKECEEDSL
jgi:hypothetical protein